MKYPILSDGSSAIELPYPTTFTVQNLVGEAVNVSLGGTDMSDTFYHKYAYTLSYETISTEDYTNIKNFIETQYTNARVLLFSYEKFPELSQPVNCKVRMSDKSFVAGSGTEYLSSVDLVITEIYSR